MSIIIPFAWRDRPSLIERLLPAQKLSAEAQKERKAGIGQTLTALGSYWKGRKPLILVKACVLGSLLPATDNPEGDLRIFEALMAIDDEAFLRREFRPSCFDLVKRLHDKGAMSAQQAESLFEVRCRRRVEGRMVWQIEPFHIEDLDSYSRTWLQWHDSVGLLHRHQWELAWVRSHTYIERVSAAKRPEELEGEHLFEPIWNEVNTYLGTQAESFPQLVEQLGILRFGTRPRIGDTFCGGGSIPFEAARLGCDVYASDLNPIACMLTWGALNIIGAAEPKLDNYQNFAKAFRYGDYAATMGSMKANDARLKTALEFKRSEFEGDFGKSPLRAILFALYELQREVDIDEAISHLRDLVPGYLSRREDLMALATVIAAKRETKAPAEAQAARILFSRIKNERLG